MSLQPLSRIGSNKNDDEMVGSNIQGDDENTGHLSKTLYVDSTYIKLFSSSTTKQIFIDSTTRKKEGQGPSWLSPFVAGADPDQPIVGDKPFEFYNNSLFVDVTNPAFHASTDGDADVAWGGGPYDHEGVLDSLLTIGASTRPLAVVLEHKEMEEALITV